MVPKRMKRERTGGVSDAGAIRRTAGDAGWRPWVRWAVLGCLAGAGGAIAQTPTSPTTPVRGGGQAAPPSVDTGLADRLAVPADPGGMTNGLPVGMLPDGGPVRVEYFESSLPEVVLEAPAVSLAGGTQQGTDQIRGLDPGGSAGGGRTGGGAGLGIPPLLRWGPLTAHPRAGYGMTYGTGVRGRGGQSDATLLHQFSPGFALDVGRYWVVDYAPTAMLYGSSAFRDTVNHSVSVMGSVPGRVWTLSAGGRFALQDNPLVETGQQTETTQVSANLGAGRSLTEVLSMSLGASYSFRDASAFNTVASWSSQNSLDYQIRENLSAGLVLGFGYDQVDPGSDMVSERVQGRFGGVLGEKLSYSLMGGFEVRQFQEGDSGSLLSPIFTGGLSYAATETTSLGLSFQQSVSPSFFNDQVNQTTAVSAAATQRLLEKLSLSVSGSYRWNERSSTANTSQQQGTDEFVSVQVSLGTRFLKRGSMSVFWSWSDNVSTQSGLGFTSEQVGLNVSYGF